MNVLGKKWKKMFHALHKVDMCACYAKQKINLACPNEALINLRNDVDEKAVPENENLHKVIDFIEKSLASISNKQVKSSKQTTKQILQRFPIALT